ncbi:preprotein translocase subunit SECE1 [Populus alba x Populus x berolinensis]|uniref:Preprotein translocase subunit SECE1 n=1 Tax=Populus alba x Populus x berolinensis TaxID=444605 RepID=A0AAD6MMV6_9ROSI|nr:preprotein translocase subunit SECE1 [Populus alba x Populus x berolinensis]
MALSSLSIKLPPTQPPSKPTHSNPTLQFKPPPLSFNIFQSHPKILTITLSKTKERRGCFAIKAVEKESTESEAVEKPGMESEPESSVTGELGAEIKKAMMERKSKEEGNFWSGVAEEIQEIEWPAFGKVLGTTGVVIGVIVGSSVVLLTVNAVLAELSDRVFAEIFDHGFWFALGGDQITGVIYHLAILEL